VPCERQSLGGMRPGLKDFCRLALGDAVVDAQPEQCTSLFPKWPDPIAFSCRFQMLYNGGSKSALCHAMDFLIAVALTYLLVVMRLPPLYGPPEKNSTPKAEPPDDRKPSR
jgi:hypothetical protein